MDTVEIPSKILVRDKDAASLKTSFIRSTLSSITQQESAKQSTTWESILGYTPDWQTVNSKLWKTPVPSKFRDTAWLICRNSHFTGELALKSSSTRIPSHCKCGQLETQQHIFLDCPLAQEVWHWIRDKWSSISSDSFHPPSLSTLALAGYDLPPSSPSWHKSLRQILYMCAVHAIWIGRCRNVYGESSSPYVGDLIVNVRRVKRLLAKVNPNLRGQHLL